MPALRRRRQRGFVLIATALISVVLALAAGLALDAAQLQCTRHRAQTAADSAAIGASLELKRGSDFATAASAARDDAALNAFPDGRNGIVIEVNRPPHFGTYAGNPQYIETLVKSTVPTMFMALSGRKTVDVMARAVAKVDGGLAE